jgi:hypothetical protein
MWFLWKQSSLKKKRAVACCVAVFSIQIKLHQDKKALKSFFCIVVAK